MKHERVKVIGIGVQRASTTWLFACLEEHPEVRAATIANNKELNFFNHNYEKGYPWYHRRFEFGPWKTAEYSVLYFHDKNVPARIHGYNPNAKLILSLRNPIDRAFSQHKLEIRRNRLPAQLFDFSKALEQNPSYVEQGRYATHLERWLKFFDLHQIHVLLFDEIASRPGGVLYDLFSFLGVQASFRPSMLDQKVNVSYTYRSRALHRSIRAVSRRIRQLLGEATLNTLKATKLPGAIRRFNEIEVPRDLAAPPSEAVRSRLKGILGPEIERLEALLDMDLSRWKR